MTTRITFQGVTQSVSCPVKCPDCGRDWTKTESTTYYRNGFHNESETREKNRVELERRKASLAKHGLICKSCTDKRLDLPVTKKVGKGEWAVYERKAPSGRIGTVKKEWRSYVACGVTWEYAALEGGKPVKREKEVTERTLKDAADRVLAKHRGIEKYELHRSRSKAEEAIKRQRVKALNGTEEADRG